MICDFIDGPTGMYVGLSMAGGKSFGSVRVAFVLIEDHAGRFKVCYPPESSRLAATRLVYSASEGDAFV